MIVRYSTVLTGNVLFFLILMCEENLMKSTETITPQSMSLHQIACFWLLALVLLVYGPQAIAQVVEKGLVSYWSFDKVDVEGKIVKDLSLIHI